jgi:hypothetical protein
VVTGCEAGSLQDPSLAGRVLCWCEGRRPESHRDSRSAGRVKSLKATTRTNLPLLLRVGQQCRVSTHAAPSSPAERSGSLYPLLRRGAWREEVEEGSGCPCEPHGVTYCHWATGGGRMALGWPHATAHCDAARERVESEREKGKG